MRESTQPTREAGEEVGAEVVRALDRAAKGSGVRPLRHRTQAELGKTGSNARQGRQGEDR